MIGGATLIRFAFPFTVEMDLTKLQFSVTFESTLGGTFERQLTDFFPDSVVGWVQKKYWMDNTAMRIWCEQIYKHYTASSDVNLGLFLDEFVC